MSAWPTALLLALALALAPGVAGAQAEPQLSRARLELAGPLEQVRVTSGANETTLDAHLAPGERCEVLLPVVTNPGDVDPRTEAIGGGDGSRARFVAWDEPFADRAGSWWDALSAGLRARPRPSLPGSDAASLGRAPAPALLVLLAFVPLAIALRRRPKLCATLSIVSSGALFAITLGERPAASYARVLEGDGTSQRWLAIDCAIGSLRIQAPQALRIALEPAHAPVSIRAPMAAAERGPWELRAGRARLWCSAPCDAGERKFTPQGNAWGTLEECWVRAADGGWSARGIWEIGKPLPAAGDGPGDPPGWLNPALPMGSSILIGRLAPGSFAGEGAGVGPAWVRLVGF